MLWLIVLILVILLILLFYKTELHECNTEEVIVDGMEKDDDGFVVMKGGTPVAIQLCCIKNRFYIKPLNMYMNDRDLEYMKNKWDKKIVDFKKKNCKQ